MIRVELTISRRHLLAVVGILVAAALAVPGVAWAADRFDDVPSSNVFSADIEWLADAGITKGCNPPANTRFCPGSNVTREQMAAFMHRLSGGDDRTIDGRLDALEAENERLKALLAGVSREGSTLLFEGMNLQVVNGMGTTESENALGNIIIGYNEEWEKQTATAYRSGSHYLVVGSENGYSGAAGIVAGFRNLASASYASIVGGSENAVLGQFATVTGGQLNQANNGWDSVTGGYDNAANGRWASVTGGTGNWANSHYASVTGGRNNTAGDPSGLPDGEAASVSGGSLNQATGFYASISGGASNTATEEGASVTGGNSNQATEIFSSVSGGFDNTASGNSASVSGGASNVAGVGAAASVSGGYDNDASGDYTSILGGDSNFLLGIYSHFPN